MNVYIVRHGQTDMNVNKEGVIDIPDYKVELNSTGIEEAFKCGEFLKDYITTTDKTLVFVSPYTRAKQTFMEINKSLNISTGCIVEEDLIKEQSYGLFHGIMDKSKVADVFPSEYAQYMEAVKRNGEYFTARPYGESHYDVVQRANTFLNKLLRIRESEVDNMIIITHHNFIRCLLKAINYETLDWFYNENGPQNCSVIHFDTKSRPKYIYKGKRDKWVD